MTCLQHFECEVKGTGSITDGGLPPCRALGTMLRALSTAGFIHIADQGPGTHVVRHVQAFSTHKQLRTCRDSGTMLRALSSSGFRLAAASWGLSG